MVRKNGEPTSAEKDTTALFTPHLKWTWAREREKKSWARERERKGAFAALAWLTDEVEELVGERGCRRFREATHNDSAATLQPWCCRIICHVQMVLPGAAADIVLVERAIVAAVLPGIDHIA